MTDRQTHAQQPPATAVGYRWWRRLLSFEQPADRADPDDQNEWATYSLPWTAARQLWAIPSRRCEGTCPTGFLFSGPSPESREPNLI